MRPDQTWSDANHSPEAMLALQNSWSLGSAVGGIPAWDARQELYVRAPGGGDPQEARELVESYMASGTGLATGHKRLARQVGVGVEVDPESREGAEAVEGQLALADQDGAAFRGVLLRSAHQTAYDLLHDSDKAIRKQLAGFGITDLPEDLVNFDSNLVHLPVPAMIVEQNQGKAQTPAEKQQEQVRQAMLAEAAGQLVRIQADIKALLEARQELVERESWNNPLKAMEHRQRGEQLADLEKYPDVDVDASEIPDGASVAQLEAMLADKRRELKLRWIQLEQHNPMLAAFRDRGGTPAEALETLTEGGEEQKQAVVAQVLPKLRNLGRVRSKIDEGDLQPLALPQVASMTRQRLRVPAGSMRDAVFRDEVDHAKSGDFDWAMLALSLGLAAITAIPTGGSSVIAGVKVAAELVMLGADVWQAGESLDDYATQKAACDTDLDQAKSLSDEEPSLAWLAVDLLAIPQGVGSVRTSFREARQVIARARALRAAVEKGADPKLFREELNRLGKQHGLPDGEALGERVEREARSAAPGAAPAAKKAATDAIPAGELAVDHLATLEKRLGHPVELVDDLDAGVHVDFDIAKNGDVSVERVRIGRSATAADVLAHKATIALAQRYNGAWGELCRVLDDIKGLFGKTPALTPGTPEWKAWLEGEKYFRLAQDRRALLAGMPPAGRAAILRAEIETLEQHAEKYAELAQHLRGEKASNAVVASPNFERWGAGKSDEVIAESGAHEVPEGPWITPQVEGRAAPRPTKALERQFEKAVNLADVDPDVVLHELLDDLRTGKSSDFVSMRKRMRGDALARAEAEVEILRGSAAFKAMRSQDPEEAARLLEHVRDRVASRYFDILDESSGRYLKRLEKLAANGAPDDDPVFASIIKQAAEVRPIGGKLPINHEFAGDFLRVENLKPKYRKRVTKYLDQAGLEGIPFTRNGQPDLSHWIVEHNGVKLDADIGALKGTRGGDFDAADDWVRQATGDPDWEKPAGFTWHHHEDGRLILVPTPLHEAVKHTGTVSKARANLGDPKVYGKGGH